MSEEENRPTYPLSFDVVQTVAKKSRRRNIRIGNSGGKYVLAENSNYFEQRFTPDESWNKATENKTIRKYSSLYPAILWHFLKWQSSLPESDLAKTVSYVEGWTNETMSKFRANLLGDAYTFQFRKNYRDPLNPKHSYRIDLNRLRENKQLMSRLEKYAKRAKTMNYFMTIPVSKQRSHIHL